DAPDLAAAADTYTSELMRVLGTEAVLDLALLGMGPDGHIASVFPGPALDRPDLAAAADTYTSELMRVLGTEAVLDLALLGMGPDGHIASVFPGHALLAERDRLVSPIFDSPKPPARPLTLTLPVLAKVRRVIVVAFGSSKADALQEAL